MSRRVLAAAITVVLAATLTSCRGTPSGSATPPPFTPTSVPTTPTPSSPGDPTTVADAVASYRLFIAATDVMASSGGRDVSELQKHASGAMLAAELNQATTFKAQKWHSVGKQKVVWAKALKIAPASADGQINEITVQACVDSSQAIALTADGKKVRPPGAPTQLVDEMKMLRAGGVWKANFPQSRKAGKC
jgi:hypothetical protein